MAETPQIADEPRASARGRLNNEFEWEDPTIGGGTQDRLGRPVIEILGTANF